MAGCAAPCVERTLAEQLCERLDRNQFAVTAKQKNASGVDRNRCPIPARFAVAGGHAAGKTRKYIRINRQLLRATGAQRRSLPDRFDKPIGRLGTPGESKVFFAPGGHATPVGARRYVQMSRAKKTKKSATPRGCAEVPPKEEVLEDMRRHL